MNRLIKTSLAMASLAIAAQASAQVTLYSSEAFRGEAFTTEQNVGNLDREGFNDRASSVVVEGGAWEVCEDAFFRGRCVVLRPGRYTSLATTGLNDRISSVRRAEAAPRDSRAVAGGPAEITLYDREGFAGQSLNARETLTNLEREGFNDRASSAVVTAGSWEVCSDQRSGGRCVVLRPGQYPSLGSMGLNAQVSSIRRMEAPRDDASRPTQAAAAATPSATFYEKDGFGGRSFTTEEKMSNLDRQGFRGRAGSVEVEAGIFVVCDDLQFGGRCMQLQPGRYPSVASMGLRGRVASIRSAAPEPRVSSGTAAPLAAYDARRRGNERLYQANITAVREVKGTDGQRCWVEREPAAVATSQTNVPAAVVGAVLGGILGHQIGGGRGKDLATAGGAVAGAFAGANVGQLGEQAPNTRDVQRCTTDNAQAKPAYWEVTYNFRGVDHHVQMSTPPQATVTVNEQGEPRV